MSKGSDAIAALLKDAKGRQSLAQDGVRAAEKTLVKRRAVMVAIDAEVRKLEGPILRPFVVHRFRS